VKGTRLIGIVLAAGAGRRLRPYTDSLPKTLVPVDGETTILDIALRNLAEVDLREVAVVVGYAASAVEQRQAALERRYGVRLTLVHNDKAEIWNNAYSLWLARDLLAEGALLVNGDTVHPVAVEETLLAARGAGDIVLAVDRAKTLGEEEMKLQISPDGALTRITKLMDPAEAHGEYIGATLIEAEAGTELADALQTTFERNPDLYYEDGYQELADRGHRLVTASIPEGCPWVEVDDLNDLEKARAVACLY
jgi:choline kinase